MEDFKTDEAHFARIKARRFVAALEPHAQVLWRRMPEAWTPMMSLVRPGEKQSTVSARLGVLRRAHFVEVRQEGRVRLYRPMPKVRFLKEVRR